MKKKGKGCLIGCGASLLGIVILIIALYVVGTILGNASMVEDAVEDIFDDRIYETTIEDVAKILESEEKTQELEALILSTLAENTLGTNEYDTEEVDEVERLTRTLQRMETAEYRNEKVRDAFDICFKAYFTELLETGNYRQIAKIYDTCLYFETDFYNTPRDLLTSDFILNATRIKREEVFNSEDLDTMMEYFTQVTTLLEEVPVISAAEMLPVDVVIPILTENATSMIIKDGVGGYYDDLKEDYKNGNGTFSALDVELGTTSTIYSFHGDFMTRSSSKRYTRKNGSALEESQLSKKDESSITVYYCGEEISVHEQYFYKAFNYDCVYQKGDYYFAADEQGIVCFKGKYTFALSYTDEH